jgi:hypothetical protein
MFKSFFIAVIIGIIVAVPLWFWVKHQVEEYRYHCSEKGVVYKSILKNGTVFKRTQDKCIYIEGGKSHD